MNYDKLSLLFVVQRDLNLKIARKCEIKELENIMEFDFADDGVRRKWLNNVVDAMLSECFELKDSVKEWWWKESKFDKQNAKVELVDILHFWITCCQIMEMEPNDVFNLYMEKNKLNHLRQDRDYKHNIKAKLRICQECKGSGECDGIKCVCCDGEGYIEDNKCL
jgi:dimeric dUTPase (all-alpha-NTP-PPase superfamily)